MTNGTGEETHRPPLAGWATRRVRGNDDELYVGFLSAGGGSEPDLLVEYHRLELLNEGVGGLVGVFGQTCFVTGML